jgi:hypothetical protein
MLDVKGRKPLELSKIGDPLVNLLYSLALSKSYNRPFGKKVSNHILSEALTRSMLRVHAGSRMKKADLGDFVEGLIFKSWAEGKIKIEDAVETLSESLGPESRGKQLEEESISGFANLLKQIDEL